MIEQILVVFVVLDVLFAICMIGLFAFNAATTRLNRALRLDKAGQRNTLGPRTATP